MRSAEIEEAYNEDHQDEVPNQGSVLVQDLIDPDDIIAQLSPATGNDQEEDVNKSIETNFHTESRAVENEEISSTKNFLEINSATTFRTDSIEECSVSLAVAVTPDLNADKSLAVQKINPDSASSPDFSPFEVRNELFEDNAAVGPTTENIVQRTCSTPSRLPSTEIAEAPRVMAKSTGASFAKNKRGRPKKGLNPRNDVSENNDSFNEPNMSFEFVNFLNQRSTRTRTGSLERINLNESVLEDQQFGFNYFYDSGNQVTCPMPSTNIEYPVQLPLPVPEPPESGMVISRGKWTNISKRGSRGKGGTYTTGIRKHHYSPYTITGKVFSKTLATLAEPEGEHQCLECPAKYNKIASLEKHIQRAHNPNLKFKCPECPKMLSCKNAIKKHLLSHRPETEW